jgi:ribosomal protein L11 methyltransferase
VGESLSLTIEAPERLEDPLVALLWAHGGLGSWSEPAGAGRVRIHGYLAPGTDGARLRRALAIDAAVAVSPLERVGDRDWAAPWRRAARPIEVGRRFLVDPREPDEIDAPAAPGARILLHLPARTAFGTGAHESTRLALELLEQLDLEGSAVLDVGSGSGILAFAALALGARKAVALDVDPAAALLIPAYASLNASRLAAFVGRLAALAAGARFDLALVNVVPPEIAPDLPRLATLVRPGGLAIFSGILASEAERALAALGAAGFAERDRRSAGEWLALVCVVAAARSAVVASR